MAHVTNLRASTNTLSARKGMVSRDCTGLQMMQGNRAEVAFMYSLLRILKIMLQKAL